MSSAGTEHVARDPSAPGPLRTSESQAASADFSVPHAHGRWAAVALKSAPAAIPAAVMLALGLWGLARDSSVSNDEAATSIAARLSLSQLVHLLRHIDAVHGLYYLLMHGWVAIGSSPVVLRFPSVIAMSVAAALTGVLAARLSQSAMAGVFSGLIMAFTPVISYYAQTARSYAFVYACVVGATLALVAAVRAETAHAAAPQSAAPTSAPTARVAAWSVAAPARRAWLLYVALIALGGYLNEMSLLALAAHAVTLLLGRYRLVVLKHWVLAGVAGAALVGPLGLISFVQHADVSWIPPPNATDMRILFNDYFAATPVAAALLVACAIVAVLPGRVAGRAGRTGASGQEAADQADAGAKPARGWWWLQGGMSVPSVALPMLIVPALLLISESFIGGPLYVDRYVLYGESGAALLAGAGLYRVGQWLRTSGGRRWLAWAPGAIVCVAVLLLQLGHQQSARMPRSRLYDFNAPAGYIGASARPGDGVLFFNTFFRKARLLYPRQFRNTDDIGQALSPMQAGTFRGTDKPFSTLRPLMLDRRRIWVVGVRPSVRLSDLLLRQQSLLLTRYFTLVSDRHFRGIDVTLWVRSGTAWPKARSSGGS